MSGNACFRAVVDEAAKALRNAAGNYYVNDKSTGSIVAQQPFGGARASGKCLKLCVQCIKIHCIKTGWAPFCITVYISLCTFLLKWDLLESLTFYLHLKKGTLFH